MSFSHNHAGSSTDLLTASEIVTQDQNTDIEDSKTRTDPIPVSRIDIGNSSSNAVGHTGESKDITESQPPRNTDEAKTASGGVVGTSEASSLEEDWVNVSLSPNHSLYSYRATTIP